ncbi:hypothetical protein B0H14DRAFT_2580617 [Mycena olivaceomarginata]|nr:hypothetical protein B0H14DRAFT_2580617 [Mycena olivaceomarginata]
MSWLEDAAIQRPGAVSCEDEHEDFYEGVVLWWWTINPAWRKEGVDKAEGFAVHGLKTLSGGDLESLPSGLNGLTSVLACLAWWYWVAGVAEGTPEWRKLVEDVVWVLMEKHRVLVHKRAPCVLLENPISKHRCVE